MANETISWKQIWDAICTCEKKASEESDPHYYQRVSVFDGEIVCCEVSDATKNNYGVDVYGTKEIILYQRQNYCEEMDDDSDGPTEWLYANEDDIKKIVEELIG